jgi:chaperonin GroES
MSLQPLSNFVVVDPTAVADKIGSIYIPPNAQEKSQKGTIIAVGPGMMEHGTFVATTLKIGDVVLYQRYAGIEVEDSGKKVIILRENEIFSKISG